MILADKAYPIQSLLRKNDNQTRPLYERIDQEMEKDILKTLCYIGNKKKALEKHDLFKQLCGNPLSVQIFASYCKSKKVQSDENALLTFYRIIKDELSSLTEDEAEVEVKDKINANKISVKLSVEAAMKLLKSMTVDETFNIYYELLFLMSCLPDGISKEHIT